MDVDVFLAGWEIECCLPPPGEGDDVSWPLLWVDDLTRGRVLTVRVVEQTYQRTTGAYAPVPGDFVLRQVSRSPRWFHGDLDRPPDRGPLPDLVRQQSGVLVGLHLETPGG